MSAAAAAMARPAGSAYRDDDGDNGHIAEDAYDDGLPSYLSEDESEEASVVSAPMSTYFLPESCNMTMDGESYGR